MASSATNAIALPPKQLKSLGAAPCASSTAICKMDVLLLAKNSPHPLWRTDHLEGEVIDVRPKAASGAVSGQAPSATLSAEASSNAGLCSGWAAVSRSILTITVDRGPSRVLGACQETNDDSFD